MEFDVSMKTKLLLKKYQNTCHFLIEKNKGGNWTINNSGNG